MIIHSHGRGAGIYARLIRLFNRKLKVVHNFHGIHIRKFSFSLMIERFLKILTNKFIFVSKSEQQIALKYRLTRSAQCVLIENGIQINNRKYMEKDKSYVLRFFNAKIPLLRSLLRHKSFIIGMLSRFDRIKNIPYAIRTLSDYLKNHDDVFLIIGGEGEERKKIEQTIEQYNLLNKVILLGYVKDIQLFFLLIDVYLNTSYGEAFGLSTVEAMEYGKPVIASKVYGNTDVVDDNNTGLLFPLNKPSLLVERIKILKNDQKIYDHLVENARESVKKRFDLNRMLNETRELYLSLARRNMRIGINASNFLK
jgi:glycosyltransferase involved in cell wall biosynthesis